MSVSFRDHVTLLEQFLAGREQIVDNIDRRLLNAHGKIGPATDREIFDDLLNACFFESPAVPRGASRLRGQLAAAHRADGFEPAFGDGYSRELDVVELVLRAHHQWHRDRWPGRNGRVAYAQSLYAVFILRHLEQLSLRIWDEGDDTASERVRQLQHVLDLLNTAGAAPLVRDVRWLIQTAQGPLTKGLRPYFVIADRVCGSFALRDRLEIHTAGAALAGGHLRSQLRHRSWQTGWTFDDPQLLAMTHLSSSMDTALLVQDLIPLLDAYSVAYARDDAVKRVQLADAILQGLSADPERLLTRLDLLAASTMIEDLFVERDAGQVRYTEMGHAHLQRLKQYCELIGRAAPQLKSDVLLFDPSHKAYSPLGIVYGFCADLFSNMVLATLLPSSSVDLTLEDLFNSRDRLEEKRTQAQRWQRLPKAEGEPDAFEHSTEWAQKMFARLLAGLEARATRPTEHNASTYAQARLYVVPRGVATDSGVDGSLPTGIVSAQEHCLTSDSARARQTGSTPLSIRRLLDDRAEGRFLASINSEGVWFAVSKALLTTCIGQGKDALITDVPQEIIDVLRLVCPEVHVIPSEPTTFSRQ